MSSSGPCGPHIHVLTHIHRDSHIQTQIIISLKKFLMTINSVNQSKLIIRSENIKRNIVPYFFEGRNKYSQKNALVCLGLQDPQAEMLASEMSRDLGR